MRYMCSTIVQKNVQAHENKTLDIALQCPGYHRWHLRQVVLTNFSQTHSWALQSWEDKTMEATTPELGPVCFWSPKSSSFSGSDSIVVEEAAKNF